MSSEKVKQEVLCSGLIHNPESTKHMIIITMNEVDERQKF